MSATDWTTDARGTGRHPLKRLGASAGELRRRGLNGSAIESCRDTRLHVGEDAVLLVGGKLGKTLLVHLEGVIVGTLNPQPIAVGHLQARLVALCSRAELEGPLFVSAPDKAIRRGKLAVDEVDDPSFNSTWAVVISRHNPTCGGVDYLGLERVEVFESA